MTEYEVFCTYQALKLHFTSEGYDYIKFHGKTRLKPESYIKRNDKGFFRKINKMYPQKEDLEDFLISGFSRNPELWIGDFLTDEAVNHHTERERVLQSMAYVFQEDCRKVLGTCKVAKKMLQIRSGDYPLLLRLLMDEEVTLETVCILNGLIGFLQFWKDKIDDSIVWPDYYMRIKKYSTFLQYDKERYTNILKNIM